MFEIKVSLSYHGGFVNSLHKTQRNACVSILQFSGYFGFGVRSQSATAAATETFNSSSRSGRRVDTVVMEVLRCRRQFTLCRHLAAAYETTS